MGTLALKIETGRYTGTPVEHRMCSCGTEVETEEHFLLRCPHYITERTGLYMAVLQRTQIDCDRVSDAEVMLVLFKNSNCIT